MEAKWFKHEPWGRLVGPLGTKVGFLTFSDFLLMPFWNQFWTLWVLFLDKKSMPKSMQKTMQDK